jgi:multisubunit Na+/H+ antiporter MnhB subunit
MRIALILTRVGAPLILVAIGVLLCVLGHGHYTSVFANRDSVLCTMGVGFIVIAMMVVLLNWLMRLAAESGDDRDREDAAREYFVRNGHWPHDS